MLIHHSVWIGRLLTTATCRRTANHVRRLTTKPNPSTIELFGRTFKVDHCTNISPKILEKLDRRLHCKNHHPLYLIRKRIENFYYKNYLNRWRNPMFSVYDSLNPVVTLAQNFDSLLVPKDHPSRKISDSYYINSEYMLRAHTSAHQTDLIRSGLDAFLVFGDVYRRDTIDSSHYPVFHQVEGVRLFSEYELFSGGKSTQRQLSLLEDGNRDATKQATHRVETVKALEHSLKSSLEKLAFHLFGNDIEIQWVDAYFPFTHPSWEMEIQFQGEWMEVLGCGIMEQQILDSAGAGTKVGWAFGLGLERLAMKLYDIPDIRVFWSTDPGFLMQFEVDDPDTKIKFKPVSQYPPCKNDISFWIPEDYSENDFYDIVRSVGGDMIENVCIFDEFYHPKKQQKSHAYHIVYRHMERNLTQEEVNEIHQEIENQAVEKLGVELR